MRNTRHSYYATLRRRGGGERVGAQPRHVPRLAGKPRVRVRGLLIEWNYQEAEWVSRPFIIMM